MKTLIKKGFDIFNAVSYGNMFLLGNGRYGYRGTLEEYRSDLMVNLTVPFFYDRYQDKWREPINLPNPFYLHILDNNVLDTKPIDHYVELDIGHAVWKRHTEFPESVVDSIRFVSNDDKDLLCERITITPKNKDIEFYVGTDKRISEINGPHFANTHYSFDGNSVLFRGVTNEKRVITTRTTYECNIELRAENAPDSMIFRGTSEEPITITIYTRINQNGDSIPKESFDFDELLRKHGEAFAKRWELANVDIEGDEDADFEMKYSIYHLLILEDENSFNSIPARGVSGQTYKGAIFWDTEMFILPFLLMNDVRMARNTLVYRINTLKGAMAKAKEYGYEGAFYAWESQEDGTERCSKYNVTDPITNEPIRTYFNEKQIHISGDIPLAFARYVDYTGDTSILDEGGLDVIIECAKFFRSYAVKGDDGLYHLNDVIGPDEYHERCDDNAFTNYLAAATCDLALKYSKADLPEIKEFREHLYLPVPNENKIIEQFRGYFGLEDVTPDIVKSRVTVRNQYLGGKNGPAYPTKTIKQADVVSLLAVLSGKFPYDVMKANYDYYLPYTEHGSSLSASMYSLVGSWIGEKEYAYEMFRKSSGIDLGTDQKMYAGGIYIGGTHPASNAGAYLSAVYGFCGLSVHDGELSLNPHLPDQIKSVRFKATYMGNVYDIYVSHDETRITKED